jgi:GNAT superfamily N-acetyltransferase
MSSQSTPGPTQGCRVLEVSACAGEPDDRLSLDIYNAVWPHDAVTMDEVHSFRAGARDHAGYLAYSDGEAVGSAVAAILPQRAHRVFTLITVLAGHRRRGAGSALYRAVSAWAAERDLRVLEVSVSDNDEESLTFAQRRGFAEERREFGVVLRLADIAPPEVRPPDGIEILTWAQRPDLARGMYEVALEAEPDIPGSEDDDIEPFDDWLAHDMQGSGDRPEATFVALAGEEVVGYAKFHLNSAPSTIAHHDLSAVKRAWRRRGIARALKAAQINWAIANGYTELHTRNEERNEPIRRLNASFGYRPGIGRIYLVGPIAGS